MLSVVQLEGLYQVVCLFLLSCQDVVALLTPGDAIPARSYTFSIDVGLKHAVIERHDLFRAGSSLLTCLTFPTHDTNILP